MCSCQCYDYAHAQVFDESPRNGNIGNNGSFLNYHCPTQEYKTMVLETNALPSIMPVSWRVHVAR